MNPTPFDNQTALRRAVREFALRELAPGARERDAREDFSLDLYHRAAALGLTGLGLPEELGGNGAGLVEASLAFEELAAVDAALCVSVLVSLSLTAMSIWLIGNESQQRKYLPALARGEVLGAFAYTEPDAGSDAGAISTRAVRHGNRYLLNGSKIFITNGTVADTYAVWATLDPAAGYRGITAFIVERGFKGLTARKQHDKLGIRASDTAQLFFDDCEVPVENLLGGEGEGFRGAMKVLDRSRPMIAAQAVGIAQGALNLAVSHVKQRYSSGKPLSEQQGLQWMLADMATEVEAARLLTHQAASMWDRGLDATKESSMAKLYASETAMRVTTQALQLHGGYGYFKNSPIERFFRDAKITEIYEGTSQIQRTVIARRLLS